MNWGRIWPGLILAAAAVFITLYFTGCKLRSPLVTDSDTPNACKNFYECLYFVDNEAQTGCFAQFGKNCNSTTAENDCAKRFQRLPELKQAVIDKMTGREHQLEKQKRIIVEKNIDGCVKLRL